MSEPYETSPEARALRDALPGLAAWFGDEDVEAAAMAVREVALDSLYDEIRAVDTPRGAHLRQTLPGWDEALSVVLDRFDEARRR